VVARPVMPSARKKLFLWLEDEEGFEYPQIDESKCVQYYQCIKVCPIKAARA